MGFPANPARGNLSATRAFSQGGKYIWHSPLVLQSSHQPKRISKKTMLMNGDNQEHPLDIEAGDPAEGADFLTLFCEKFHCRSGNFEKLVFRECVHPDGRDAARLMRLVYPGFFRSDFILLEDVKYATSFSEFQRRVDYHAAQTSHEGGLRFLLKVRLSKTRLLKLAQSVFASPDAPAK